MALYAGELEQSTFLVSLTDRLADWVNSKLIKCGLPIFEFHNPTCCSSFENMHRSVGGLMLFEAPGEVYNGLLSLTDTCREVEQHLWEGKRITFFNVIDAVYVPFEAQPKTMALREGSKFGGAKSRYFRFSVNVATSMLKQEVSGHMRCRTAAE
eukprot:12077560-Karenia_brevis.AAC.1